MPKFARNFPRSEFEFSETATRLGWDNSIPAILIPNAIRMSNWLQILRHRLSDHYGRIVYINITSGYRNRRLNTRIKGSSSSAHLLCLATDIRASGLTTSQLFNFIKVHMKDVSYDQCIDEYGRWVHIGLRTQNYDQRRQDLRSRKYRNWMGQLKTRYEMMA